MSHFNPGTREALFFILGFFVSIFASTWGMVEQLKTDPKLDLIYNEYFCVEIARQVEGK